MKQVIKKVVPKNLHWFLNRINKPFKHQYKESYSQSGEDMILNTIFWEVKSGFYVDVGANNPIVNSNTHFFYKKGWSGINIDALPGSMQNFNRIRPRDINLEIPISDKEEKLNYYMFSRSFYNSFLKESDGFQNDVLIEIRELQTKTLSWILDNYLNNKEIDFLTIDVEGLDFQVLKSNNWSKYRPKVLIIELFADEIESVKASTIINFLKEKGYIFYCFTPTNAFFIENAFFKIRFNNK